MDRHYPYKAGQQLNVSTVNKLIQDTQLYTDDGFIGGGRNAILSSAASVQGLADITDSNLGDVKSHSVIYAVPRDDGSGFRWYRTHQKDAQAYYTLGNSQIECVGTVHGYDADGNPIVSENENKVMIAVQPMVIGEKYVLRGQDTLLNGMGAYWNGYRLCPLEGSHAREFVIQRTETNIQLPFDASGVKPDDGITGRIEFGPEMLYSPLRPFVNQMAVIVETNGIPIAKPEGWVEASLPRFDDGVIVNGAIGPSGQFWMGDTGTIGRVVPYIATDPETGLMVWHGFADPIWPPGVMLPGFIDQNGLPVIVGTNTYAAGLDIPAVYEDALDKDYAEALYQPAPIVEEDLGSYVKVVFPVNYPPMQTNILPNPMGYTLGDEYDMNALLTVARGGVPLTGFKRGANHNTVKPTARGTTACSMGLVVPLDETNLEVQVAKYSSLDLIPFVVYTMQESRDLPSEPPPIYRNCYGLEYQWERVKSLDNGNMYLFRCMGTFTPDPLGTNIEFTLDPLGFGGEPFYQRKYNVATENSHVVRDDYLFSDSKYEIAYEYEKAVEETIQVAPPVLPGCVFDSVYSTTDSETGETILKLRYNYGSEHVTIDRPQYELLFQEYGTITFKYIDTQTGYMTYTFKGKDYEEGRHTLGSAACWYGFTVEGRMGITSKRSHAQRKCYPAFCPTLDKNEVLIPGEICKFETAKVSINSKIHKSLVPGSDWEGDVIDIRNPTEMMETEYVEFEYLVLTPPEVYHTDVDCTPKTITREIKYSKPTFDDIEEKKIIRSDDFFVDSEHEVQNPSSNNVPHTMRYSVPITKNSVPEVREPFGAFNDCENTESLAIFVKVDSDDVKYPCTCRLDYIPYGYALATKTPSCFYKATAADNCAPKLKGVVYDIKRVDGKLLINGGCYVPCSTLSSNTSSSSSDS